MLPDRFDTARLILRPIAAHDAQAIFAAYAHDPAAARFMTWTPHQTVDDTNAYIASCLAEPPHSERTYVLESRAGGQLLGALELRRPARHRLGFGFVLAQAHWNQGLMTEALTEVAAWAMRHGRIWRIESVCDVENTASARVMEKAELIREGILRRYLVHPNLSPEPRDCFSYARAR